MPQSSSWLPGPSASGFSTRSAFTCTRSKWPAASFCSCSVRRCFSEKWTRKREDRQRRDAISRCFRWRCLPSPGGAMMAVIVLTDNDVYTVPERIETGVVLLVVLFLTYLLLLFSDAILRVIGRQGASVLVRVMGLILCSLAVEIVLTPLGVGGWTPGAH